MFAAIAPPPPPSYEQVCPITNPLLEDIQHLPFDQVSPSDFMPAYETACSELKQKLAQLQFNPSLPFANFLTEIETLETKKKQLEFIFGLFCETLDSSELRAITKDFEMLRIESDNELYHHEEIVHFLSHFKKPEHFERLTASEQRALNLRYNKLLIQGAFLSEEDKESFTSHKKALALLEQTFTQNVNDHIQSNFITVYHKDQLADLPASMFATAANNHPANRGFDEGPWAFYLDTTTVRALLRLSPSRELRRQAFLKYNEIATLPPSSNKEVVASILTHWQAISELLGFENYTQMSLYTKMAPSKEAILDLFSEVKTAAKEAYTIEKEELAAFAKAQGFDQELQVWDKAFYAHKLKNAAFDLDFEALKTYFSFDHVIDTFFTFCSELFDIDIRKTKRKGWHDDVRYYTVHDQQGVQIASFYVDPFARVGQKRPGAWMEELDSHFLDVEGEHLPMTYLVTNFTKAEEGAHLMSLRDVETLFHEFGHTLQHLLSTQTVKTLSGLTNIEWDGVEIASQFMENWLYYKPLLTKLAIHSETGAPLDEAILDRVIASRSYRQGGVMLQHILLATLDLELYSDSSASADAGALCLHLLEEAGLDPHPAEQNFSYRFEHIFGNEYQAGYYSYLYAHIRSADLFAAFEEIGFNPEGVATLGKQYKETFLEMGSLKDPDEVFFLFRGRAPETKALIRHLGLTSEPITD